MEGIVKRSEAINELAAALAKAQGGMKAAIKDAANPFFKSKYADLGAIVEVIRDQAASYGLSYTTPPVANEFGVGVGCVLMHSSGQWIEYPPIVLPVAKADAQGFGSCLTYARRYMLSAVFGVATEDDDGNAAAASVKSAKDAASEAMRTLKAAAKKGTPALEAAWKSIDNETRRIVQADLPALKEEAANALGA